MTSATSPIILKWDPKSLEIRTLTVERLLEPLVTQVSCVLYISYLPCDAISNHNTKNLSTLLVEKYDTKALPYPLY